LQESGQAALAIDLARRAVWNGGFEDVIQPQESRQRNRGPTKNPARILRPLWTPSRMRPLYAFTSLRCNCSRLWPLVSG